MPKINDILIVEDNELVQQRYRALFGIYFNCNIEISADMQSAIELANRKRFGLYVTDGAYPLVTGGEVDRQAWLKFCEELKKIHPDARVIVASDLEHIENKVRAAGADYYYKSDITDYIKELARKYNAE